MLYHVLLMSVLAFGNQASDLDAVARTIADQIVAQPKNIAAHYHASFLKQVPERKLVGLYGDFYAKHGPVVSVTPLSRDKENSGAFTFAFEKNVQMKVNLTITSSVPPKIMGLWFGPATAALDSLEQVAADLRKLPGTVGFCIVRLDQENTVLTEHNPDEQLAIGSTFKLYILGAAVTEQVSWDRVVQLKENWQSLPSGSLHKWPPGSPVTVHTLATLMISVSDNTATDHLLNLVGRQRVESVMKDMGHSQPQRSWPFLSTFEMFKLKSNDKLLAQYVDADVAERRTLLSGPVAAMPRDKVVPYADGRPMAIDQVEWFASAADLCRLMDWFRRHGDKTALQIMSVNPGIDVPKEKFAYGGYKGGSEPGVLNMTWLLETVDGRHYALAASWNNPAPEGVDLNRLIEILQAAINILGKKPE